MTRAVFVWLILNLVASVPPAAAQEIATSDVREVCGWVNGQSYSQRHRTYRAGRAGYEHDHIVPLCLAGSDTDANLQWQPLDEALIKDRFERFACKAVCHGDVPLATAQAWFMGDWVGAMRREMPQ